MALNRDIFQLTGGKGFGNVTSNVTDEELTKSKASAKTEEQLVTSEKPLSKKTSTGFDFSDQDYVIESDLVTPVVKAKKSEKPLIVVVDDDFETLDLLEIYLKRNYQYEGFSGPREAIFFLNHNIPDLVFIDCKIHTMKALTFAEIIRTGSGRENVPFVFLGTEEELASINKDLVPEYFIGQVKRPVARGSLQEMIDKVIKKENNESVTE
ncbi:MAG: response regulator [Lachnospiraceae bacterium]|nr:response regulator [Lachnospiraceae bacterium]